MSYTIEDFKEGYKDDWKRVQEKNPYATFLTSLDWIAFQRSKGKIIDQFVIVKDHFEVIGILSVEIFKRKISRYGYAPYNPVVDWESFDDNELPTFLLTLHVWVKNYIEKMGLNSFRFDPRVSQNYTEEFKHAKFVHSLAPGQAKETWITDLTKHHSNTLLKNQEKDTRYTIKRAKKKGVDIKEAQSIEEISAFTDLMEEVMERKGFQTHPPSYYKDLWSMLNEKDMVKIWLAYKDDKAIAGALMVYYKKEVSYIFGASTSVKKYQKLSAPYLLHYEIMLDALNEKYKRYNFWGVVPKEHKDHAMRGLSDFKMKFDGELHSYVGNFEVRDISLGSLLQRGLEWYAYKDDRY